MPNGQRQWCFTENNPTGDYSTLLTLTGDVRYAIWQQEYGEERTLHLQGYVQFSRKLSLTQVKLLLPRAHLEVAKGSYDDNYTYCTKLSDRVADTQPYEIGIPMRAGQRTDLVKVQEKIDNGTSLHDISKEFFGIWMRNYKALALYKSMNTPKRSWETQVIVLTGPTGCGKSWYCNEHAPKAFRQCNRHWFTSYEGEEDVIFDEFYGSRFTYAYFLMLLDRYEMRVETKGGEINFCPRRIWITSNKLPWEWYSNCKWDAIARRVSYHKEISENETREEWTADVDDAISFLNQHRQ